MSVYELDGVAERLETHTICILVANEPGVLARVIGLFSGRGYNIESLTVAEVEHGAHRSRITIATTGTPMVIEQIKAQLSRLVPVYSVVDMSTDVDHVERELALVKVVGVGDPRVEAMRMADVFGARVVDATLSSLVFEISGTSDDIDRFIELMSPLGVAEISRTGLVAIGRGGETLTATADAANPT